MKTPEGERIPTDEDFNPEAGWFWETISQAMMDNALSDGSKRRAKIFNRIKKRIKIDQATKCWLWEGSHSGNGRGGGYGRMSLDGTTVAVHRVMFTLVHGYIPTNKQVDHTCKQRLCCNPEHLELVTVTPSENCKRRHQ
jgi:hypothetical protein